MNIHELGIFFVFIVTVVLLIMKKNNIKMLNTSS